MKLFPYRQNARYNVSRSDERRVSEALYGSVDHVFDYDINTGHASVIGRSEAVKVRLALEETFQRYAIQQTCEEPTFALSGDLMGLNLPYSRTVEVPCSQPHVLGCMFVETVRTAFLKHWPDWRVLVVGDIRGGEPPMLIYPSGVCIGETSYDDRNESQAISQWVELLETAREKISRPKREQETSVLDLAPTEVVRVADEKVVFLKSFDNSEGDDSFYAHWFILCDGYTRFSVQYDGEYYVDWVFDIDSKGGRVDENSTSGTHGVVVVSVNKSELQSNIGYKVGFERRADGGVSEFQFIAG